MELVPSASGTTQYTLAPLPTALMRSLTNEESARLNKLHGPTDPPTKTCHTCRKEGVFNTRLKDGEIVTVECNCREQWMLARLLLESGIGDTYQRYSWNHVRAVPEAVIAEVRDYVANLSVYYDAGIGLMLFGERTGTGKSLLTYLVLKEALAQGHQVYFTDFREMLDYHTEGWSNADTRAWFVKRLQNTHFLALDEIGKENPARLDMITEILDRVIRVRIAHGRPTLISSNLAPYSLTDGEGEPAKGYHNLKNDLTRYHNGLLSLLAERTIQIEVTGGDYRRTMTRELIADAKAGIRYPVVVR